jgi:hypothetical protein
VIAAQAGWGESTVEKMIRTYAHHADQWRLDELDAAFAAINPDAIQTQSTPDRP